MTQKQLIELSIEDLRAVVREQLEIYLPKILESQQQIEDNSDELLSTKEAAELLKVHSNTIYNWIKNGKLKKHSIGRKLLISKNELLENMKPNIILGGGYE